MPDLLFSLQVVCGAICPLWRRFRFQSASKRIKALERDISRAEVHQRHREQHDYVRDVLSSLRNDGKSALFVQDFTSITAQDNEGGMIRDLIIYLCFFDPQSNTLVGRYFDFLSRNLAEDIDFLLTAWLKLIDETNYLKKFSFLYGFSDGPTSEFKNRFLIHFFGSLFHSRGLGVQSNFFFFAHHGKYRCDSYASADKRHVNALYLKREGEIVLHREGHFRVPCANPPSFSFSLDDYASRLKSVLQNTDTFVITALLSFPRPLTPHLPGIFDCHQAVFE